MNRKQRRAATKSRPSAAAVQAETCNQRGLALVGGGNAGDTAVLLEAIDLFQRACRLYPGHAEAHNNLGASLQRLGRHAEAERACRNALTLIPGHATALYNRGLSLKALGRLEDAVDCYRKALAARPDDPDTLNNLGVALAALKRPEQAEPAFRAVLRWRPDDPEVYNNLGATLVALGAFGPGLDACRKALDLRPDHLEARTNAGTALFEQGRFTAAAAVARDALCGHPAAAAVFNNLGVALQAMQDLTGAERALRRALRLRPDFPEAHYNLSTTLLQRGRYGEGWREYEWRWMGGVDNLTPRGFAEPRWNGEDLAGRSILLYAEQGLGDTLQFSRYAAAVAARGGRVILEVPRPLVRLMGSLAGVGQVVAAGGHLPAFDCQLPLMSLPFVLGATDADNPADVPYLHAPYLHADETAVAAWAERLGAPAGLRVGLVWSGDPRPQDVRAHAVDRRRSLALSELVPLLEHPGIRFVSLQKGAPAKQLNDVEDRLRPLDPMGEVADFAATAAIIANLDLVISVDTSVAHLAGALGKRVWILSRFDGCWRWLQGRDDSPWYPTARLFRQRAPGDWDEVIARVVAALELFVSGAGVPARRPAKPDAPGFPPSGGGGRGRPPHSSMISSPTPSPAPLFSTALAHHQAGRLAQAEAGYRRILDGAPDHAASLYNLGLLALGAGRDGEAADWIGRAVALKSDDPLAYYNLGVARHRADRPADAAQAYRRAVELAPDHAKAHNNLGAVLMELGQPPAAAEAFRTALSLAPDDAQAHYNLGTASLLRGDFAIGWREFEWRRRGGVKAYVPRVFPQPQWTGDDPAGRTVLLHAEQGLGDTLQFARYATMLAERGASVILEVQRPLAGLLGCLPVRIVAQGDPLADFDLHLPLMSAPLALGTTLATIPAPIPYIWPDPARAAAWGRRLSPLPGLKVGLAWAGAARAEDAAANAIDRRRSVALERLLPLLERTDITFVSLQKGPAAGQVGGIAADRRPVDWTDELADFADTAGLIAHLDLVISVDTAVAHLAGAMGKPVWILSRFDGCWRWLMDRDDSPWYPTARLFRQKTPGDWDDVVTRVAAALDLFMRGAGVPPRHPAKPDASGFPPGGGGGRGRPPHSFMASALDHHRAGRLGAAEAGYRQALAADPTDGGCLYNLGLIALTRGDHPAAGRQIARALAVQPDNAEAWTNLGSALQAQNRLDEAIGAFCASLALRNDDARVHSNLAIALGLSGRHDQAVAAFRSALVLDPALADAQNNLGVALVTLTRQDEAIAVLRRAAHLRPDDAETHYNLGRVLQGRAAYEDALAVLRAAVAANPRHGTAWGAIGGIHLIMGRPRESESACRAALAVAPDFAAVHSNLAAALFDQGRFAEALASVRQAIALKPDSPIAYDGLAVTLQIFGRMAESLTAYRTALRLEPDRVETHYNLAMALLQDGNYAEGWPEYEWRWRKDRRIFTTRTFDEPLWTGEDLEGRTLLLHGEQGLGDVLQFARYAPLIAGLGARVVLDVPPPLKHLLKSVQGVAQVVATDEALPRIDYQLPMMSAPQRLGTTLDSVPASIPYIHPDAERAAAWRRRLAGLPGLKVGLVWAGNPRPDQPRLHLIDRRRSMPLEAMRPLLAVPGVSFVSLQKDRPAGQLAALPAALRPQHWMDEVVDFADTAALVDTLDLVIAVDTSIVHLAGALGKPVWILSRFDGCWRWLMDRDDSPWYPTARLFRQKTPGDWDEVMERVTAALELFVSGAGVPARHPAKPESPGFPPGGGGGRDSPPHSSPTTTPAQLFAEAADHHLAGRIDEATALYRRILESHPHHFDTLNNLGLILLDRGHVEEGAELITRAVEDRPADPRAQCNFGVACQRGGRLEKAVEAFRLAIDGRDDYAEARNNLGGVLVTQGAFETGEAAYRSALAAKPDYAAAFTNLSSVLYLQGRFAEAELAARRALCVHPRAETALNNLGGALLSLRRRDEAEATFRAAIALRPDFPGARYNLAMALLQKGDFIEGWREYESRWQGDFSDLTPRTFAEPRWNGEPLAGKRILLYGEQGYGDILQFARFATAFARLGAHVILEAYYPLQRLLEGVAGVAQVVPTGAPLPPFDYQLPLMSAPHLLGTTIETIPGSVPYLRADPGQAAVWRETLARLPGFKVGLVWSGNPRTANPRSNAMDRRRSLRLEQLLPLLSLPKISFVSLQKGDASAQQDGIPAPLRPLDPMGKVSDFADTAAIIDALDLVISVDTSVVHLAGALRKPVWIASRFDACWRWLENRDDSPWYPTARLFRQTAPGDWDGVVERLVEALRTLTPRPLEGEGGARASGRVRAFAEASPLTPPLAPDAGEREIPTPHLFTEALRHFEAGASEPAAALFRRILDSDPEHADATHHLGLLALAGKRYAEAARWIRRTIALRPDVAEAHNNLGIARLRQGSLATAAILFRRAHLLKPDYPAALSNWGSTMGERHRWADAAALCRRAIALQPEFSGPYSNLGVVSSEMGRPAEAESAFRLAVALSPGHAEAQYNLGTALLAQGKFEEGWRQYEWRTRGDHPEVTARTFDEPEWTGGPLAGQTILLHGEQGLGDLLQFSRYATLLAARGARVIVECYPALTRLLAGVPGVARTVGLGEPLPAFDCHLSVMSAPYRFGTRADSIPADVPYVAADPAQAAAWRQRLDRLPGMKVGLVWAGDPRAYDRRANAIDRRRSVRLEQLTPLLRLPGIRFVSLQKGSPAAQLAGLAAALRPEDWMDEMADFADTAALVANLDLVITVDTSVAHLAGALAKPVWILSRFDGCWRWLQDRDDSPWYPTARLFRQKSPGDWDAVVERVVEALAEFTSGAGVAARLRRQAETLDLPAPPDGGQDARPTRLFPQALAHHRAGRLSEARALYLRILETDPGHFDSLHHLGLIALWSDDAEGALAWFGKAIAGNRAHLGAHINLAKALGKLSRFADAVVVMRMAVEQNPDTAQAHYHLGLALHDLEDRENAAAAYRNALAVKPDLAGALTNLGGIEGETERHEQAVMLSQRALAIDPGQSRARSNLGASLHELHRIDEAVACYRQTLAENPDVPETHHNLATALLLQGRYEEGWREYEWRLKGAIPGMTPRSFDRPLWQGESLAGKTILLHGEQGFGDVLQFVRFAGLLARRDARVVLEVYAPLVRLLSSLPGVAQVVVAGEPLPPFDCHLPLLSLPHRLNLRLDTIPADVPYVTPPSMVVERWRARLAPLSGLKVGLVWAGDPKTHSPRNHAVDRRRSVTLDRLKPLLAVPGVSFVSLQKGEAARQIEALDDGLAMFDAMDEMADFADTAGLIANLDLVISVDTAVAHLAGALAKPVWLVNRFNGCWRWLDDREGSPWYPTVRLFRQASPGDWEGVVARLARELATEAKAGAIADQTLDALFAQAIGHHGEGRLDDADRLYRAILARDPAHPVILHHRGVIAQQRENPTAAIAFIRQALASRPAYMEAWTNLGTAWRDLGERGQALACLQRAIRLKADVAAAHNNLGSLLTELGRLDEAVDALRAALALAPENPEIHCNLAATLLQRGDYAEGWREHEWRLHPAVPWEKPRPLPQPVWDGEDLRGRTILLRNEQGLGDDLQFARFATPIAARGAKVILEVPSPLTRLLASVPGVAQVVAKDDPLPDFDCHLSLMSVPHRLGTTLATIPQAFPYVAPDAAAVAAWKERLGPGNGLTVGLVWAGAPRPHDKRANAIDRRRSMALARLAPLFALPDVRFVSLQKGDAAAQAADLPAGCRLDDWMDEVADFADTTALVANLDLVISVDTSVAHLAGALGKPVWILSRFDGCWRWLHDRDDSPWYPTARLFRQTTPGDWDAVVERVVEALKERVIARSGATKQSIPPGSGSLRATRNDDEMMRSEETPAQLFDAAARHHQAGRLTQAAALYRRILVLAPDHPFALHHLGLVARRLDNFAETARLIGRALRVVPDFPEAWSNLGAALNDQGKASEALLCCRRAAALRPDYAKALNNLGKSYKDLGLAAEAAASYTRALQVDPDFTMAYGNLGAALQDLDRLAEAAAACRQALALDPALPLGHNNLGVIASQRGEPGEAFRHYTRAIRLTPGDAATHVNLGMVLLQQGNFSDGWREYEWRWRGGMRGLRQQPFGAPRWTGDDPQGRTILLHAEQGLGDALQFARYATAIAARGARVLLEVQAPLKRLLAGTPGVAGVYATGEPLPDFDCHLPLMSAPHLLGTTLPTIPAEVPYVTVDQARMAAWRDRLAGLSGRRVGLVWAGNPRAWDPDANLIDRRRSMRLAQLAPLLAVPNVSFVSLQKDAPADQWQAVPAALRPHHWMDEMADFADTAALVANLDLVISVDTSVAHLAGAMGKPVWILSRFDGCWRWLMNRDDTPWYPTARLFRQKAPGDWDEVVERVVAALDIFTSGAGIPARLRRQAEMSDLPASPDGGQDARPTRLFKAALAHQQAGRLDDALAAYRAVIVLEPGAAAAYVNAAVSQAMRGDPATAATAFRRAVAIEPTDSRAFYNLGLAEQAGGAAGAAAAAFRASIDLDPAHAKAHAGLAVALLCLGRPDEAEAACRTALTLAPDSAEVYANLAAALFDQGRFAEAAGPAETAVTLRHDFAGAWSGLALVRQILGRKAAAEVAFDRALALRPDDAETHHNRAMARLRWGHFDEGWAEYEWRWQDGVKAPHAFAQPCWNGEDLQGRTLLLWAEQGLGDTLQFVRYAKPIAALGGRVVACVPAPLVALLANVPGVAQVVDAGDPLPDFDCHLPMLSAPRVLGGQIPAEIPYVRPVAGAKRGRRTADGGRLAVGLAWAGNPRTGKPRQQLLDGRRSLPLARLSPLLSVPGVRFVSLQMGAARGQIEALPAALRPDDPMGGVADFADTAAIVAELDLVIAVDTAITHLAGAMGKPVWILSRFDGCWRWLEGRDDSPWYPTARLFRQKTPGDWEDVVERVAAALALFVSGAGVPARLRRQAESLDFPASPDGGRGRPPHSLMTSPAQLFAQALVHHRADRLDAAEGLYRRALAGRPDYPEALSNLGCLLRSTGRLEEALDLHRTAVERWPQHADLWNNLGTTEKDLRHSEAAIDAFSEAIARQPGHAAAHVNLAHLLLLTGRYAKGWREYEWRWKGGIDYLRARPFTQPQWSGEDLDGRTILLHAEQGLGDTLQFARYAVMIAELGGRVIVEVQPPLRRLLDGLPGVAQVLAGREGAPLPAFDCHLPLMSAPAVLGTTLETIPVLGPYVSADPDLAQAWASRLAGLPGIKVGLVWAGAPWTDRREAQAIDGRRSVGLAALRPLLEVPGVSVVSLQMGAARGQMADLPAELRPFDPMADVTDFAETAAIASNLDLVISVDTAVAHLAGAMGKPVWILSRFDGCWRWLQSRDDSPWYPTARLFRQKTPGDWDEVVERVTAALERFVSGAGVPARLRRQAESLDFPASPDGGRGRPPHSVMPSPSPQLFEQAVAHHQAGRLDEAEALYRRLLERGSAVAGHAEAACNLGILLRQRGRLGEAAACFRRALQLRPDYPEAHNNLGLTFADQGFAADAAACYARALAVNPRQPLALSNLGVALQGLGRPGEAIAAYNQAIAIEPRLAGTHYNLGLALLQTGDFEAGWREHEWLWRGAVDILTPRQFPQPKWDGSPLRGRTILVYAEQGLGDTLQFARYATMIAERGGRVLIEVQPPLKRLGASVPGVAQCLAAGEALPDFDCHLPLMGAPFRLGTRLESVPASVPYVRPDPVDVERQRKNLESLPGLKVGLVWAGDPRPNDLRAHVVDGRRSIGLAALRPLLEAPGVSVVSLQMGAARGQIEALPAGLRPHDPMDGVADFADTAAIVANLDLVISVDTAVAHVAGALGKPVWILSRFDGCWRWLMDRDDSPWYPTARLFRQKTPGDWDEVVERVTAALERFVSGAGVPARLRRQADILDFPASPDGGRGRPPHSVTPSPSAQLFEQAVAHHRAGRLDVAEGLYRQVLAREPRNVGGLFHLGLIAQQCDRHADAVRLFDAAIALNDGVPGLHDSRGTSLLAVGRPAEAAAAHARALALKSDFFEAAYNLGNAWQQMANSAGAARCFRYTLALRPDLAEPYNNLGNLYSAERDFARAEPCYRRAAALNPAYADARNNLGNVLKEREDFAQAALLFNQALSLRPDYVEAHYNLANALIELGRPDAAIASFRRAVAARPDLTEAYNNLGSALYMQGDADEAVASFQRAHILDPRFPEAVSNLGAILRDRGEIDAACAAFRQSVALAPDYALAHANLGVALLQKGEFAEGWREFEWRRPHRQAGIRPRADLPPRWTGEGPAGRTILLQAEQGLGDALQFARYAALIADRGGRVLLEVYPPLKRLAASVPGVAGVIATTDPLPPGIDCYLPMMSAPLVMDTRLETIPAAIPYLSADPSLIERWGARLDGLAGRKVGLVWAGDPRTHDPHANAVDRRRSLDFAALSPLLEVPGVSFVSLQKGGRAAQLKDVAPDLRPLDPMDEVADFADTAAIVANLDLVISVDTSVAHLAGAMGKPVWILSRFDSCWRWLMDRDDSPWYPTARLFRQRTPGDWQTVIERMACELSVKAPS